MAEFNGSLFNDGLFDGNYVLGCGAAAGGAHAGCSGTVVKAGAARVIAVAASTLRDGRLAAGAAANLGTAVTICQPARIRKSSAAAMGGVTAASDSLRIRHSAAAAVGAVEAVNAGLRLRTSQMRPCGVAIVAGSVQKLAFPPLAQGLRVRRWSKPAMMIGGAGTLG